MEYFNGMGSTGGFILNIGGKEGSAVGKDTEGVGVGVGVMTEIGVGCGVEGMLVGLGLLF